MGMAHPKCDGDMHAAMNAAALLGYCAGMGLSRVGGPSCRAHEYRRLRAAAQPDRERRYACQRATTITQATELHEMVMGEGDVMQMRPDEGGIVVPAAARRSEAGRAARHVDRRTRNCLRAALSNT